MKPTWNDLTLSAIDLHLHAGTERPEQCSLLDVVDYSIASGRRIMALTDHFGRFLRTTSKYMEHYDGSMDGFRRFAADVREAREFRPDVYLLFTPEISFNDLKTGDAEHAFSVDLVDSFLGEPSGPGKDKSYGEYLIDGVEMIARYQDKFGRPGILVHPLRSRINTYVGKSGKGPKYPLSGPLAPLSSVDDPRAEIEALFDLDVEKLAEALLKYDIPVELNESSWGRILGHNHESFFERYLFFYEQLLAAGVRMTVGSDMHSVEQPAAVPFVGARMLGVKPTDMTWLRHWLGPVPA